MRAFVPPGAKRGDKIDLAIITPDRSQATDLRGGWLLNTRLRHKRMLNRSVRTSDVMATGTGYVLTRASHQPGEDENLKIEGRVLRGGVVQKDRELNLVLRPNYKHVKMSAAIAGAISRRFFFYDGTTRRGIAKAVEDDLIQLDVHPRYADNLPRMISVIMAMSIKPESSSTQSLLTSLGARMREPATASDAALQLEAVGENAVPTLLESLKSPNPEIRFYAAEALGYLDRTEAIDPLVEAARDYAAFRHPALLALRGMPHLMVDDAVRRLFDESSIETKYGAFVTLRQRDDGPRRLGALAVGDSFRMYQMPSTAPPAVVLSLREEPELVLFGKKPMIEFTNHLFGPRGLILKADSNTPEEVRISRFRPGKQDRRVVVGNSVAEIAKGIIAVGCGYGEVIEVLRKAKDSGMLKAQLALDPLPDGGRTYYRDSSEGAIVQKEVLN